MSDEWFLYHIRHGETSSGFGHDGYIGITRHPDRRRKQHFSALAAGQHRNAKLQRTYDADPKNLRFWIVSSGTREQVHARERLLVPYADRHLNQQRGGGPMRGMSEDDALRAASGRAKARSSSNRGSNSSGNPNSSSSSSRGSGSGSDRRRSTGTGGAGSAAGMGGASAAGDGLAAGTTGVRAAFSGAGAGAAALGTALLGVGIGSAYVVNQTILKEEESDSELERKAKQDGQVATYAGGAAGALGALGAVGASGTVVGLSGPGIVAGVTAIGTTVGGGAIAGSLLVFAAPAVAAVGIGYGAYQISKLFRR